jgi:UDP-N-acetylenolpyruvoylglucosamine reductase
MISTAAPRNRSMDATNDSVTELSRRVSPETAIRRDEPLAKRTTLRVGGPADLYVEPATEADLAAVLEFCAAKKMAFFVLGRGSNLLVRDGGFRGAVISLASPQFSRVNAVGERVQAGAGARLKAVAVEAKRNGIAGLEFLEGIPGSVGGALRMNAGAMGAAMFEVVESVRLMNFAGQAREQPASEFAAQYRSCPELKSHIALAAALRGHMGLRDAIERRMNEYSQRRWKSQPAAPSAGCIFKNPVAIPAGKLIDELGLKGARVGGAMVSLEHGNFMVNDGGATARDMLELIELVRGRIRAERGIEMQTEVEIIGE